MIPPIECRSRSKMIISWNRRSGAYVRDLWIWWGFIPSFGERPFWFWGAFVDGLWFGGWGKGFF
ncbi:hypothetical protein BDZ45DRAFT_667559 [Acephala macrosclerotiorum]|nr:hypothetical protein BDZ45DRAFT_667559 [Acephala macrosclerotiorum]